ncbi:MAG: hypothetical protein QOH05_1242 [Acetobacteraceae bacterium]|jgi:hypothetical protein|nr:hypothetical protein [Acetobacteraceae bacterium]
MNRTVACTEAGRAALSALAAGGTADAQRLVAEMQQHSERVLGCLAAFDRAYPGTVGGAQPMAA